MLDYQRLDVYQKVRQMHIKVWQLLKKYKNIPYKIRDDLERASFGVMTCIAEGAGRFTNPDKRRFYIDSRASAFECVCCVEGCYDLNIISQSELDDISNGYEEISKMLFKMIGNCSEKIK